MKPALYDDISDGEDIVNTSPTFGKITAALAEVQKLVDPVIKSKEVEVAGEKVRWKSNYAPLPVLRNAVDKHRKAAGIALLESVGIVAGLGPVLTTRAALGDEWIEVSFPVKESRQGAQGFGGGITFARRWTLCALFGIVPDDAEEGQGYKDATRDGRAAKRQGAPANLAALQDAIRSADTLKSFEEAARKARAAHPSGEGSTAIERTITSRLVSGIDGADTPEKLDHYRAAHGRIQARGPEVREAIGRAERRLQGET